ncbi:IclR family transcriptional regulator [Verticiella sediminum]|uniref:IclR family transcriptional regulator n=1 Tax=Verticiella sediminum TaxID=1247510 RepID=A0A556AGM2_9BURK|nr:IclR family transcriptional regulator [Verticiella sediminum]TSH92048.1 IclR family transcriptional regulator [Verticiella sediminum]
MDHAGEPTEASAGAQSVERAMELLRLVAMHGHTGARLLDLASRSGVARPTVHRILKRLCAERALAQEPSTKRYFLGPLLYEFGLATPSPVKRIDRLRPVLKRLADATDDTAYLTMRSGDEVVCVAIEEGAFPIRARTFELGARRPLGIGAAGLALLAALPRAELSEVLERNEAALTRSGLDGSIIERRAEQARVDGYAVSNGLITPGVTGIGFAIPSAAGYPYLAISIAAISSRMQEDRIGMLVKQCRLAARQIGALEAS